MTTFGPNTATLDECRDFIAECNEWIDQNKVDSDTPEPIASLRRAASALGGRIGTTQQKSRTRDMSVAGTETTPSRQPSTRRLGRCQMGGCGRILIGRTNLSDVQFARRLRLGEMSTNR